MSIAQHHIIFSIHIINYEEMHHTNENLVNNIILLKKYYELIYIEILFDHFTEQKKQKG